VTPFGDRAVRFTIPQGAPRRRLFAELSALPGVSDVVLTEDVGCVVFGDGGVDLDAIEGVLAGRGITGEDEPGAIHEIDVLYDGEDLDAVALAIGQSKEKVIALHSEREYRVAMLGFLPGFAYLRGLASELRLPRRAPRPRVPPGSVAIAAEYTGIYPFASPGGWHLLGRASEFDPFIAGDGEHATLAIGDVVRFSPVASAPAGSNRSDRWAIRAGEGAAPARAHLELTRAAGFAILVDGGRPGRMHDGVPPGGPLVRSLLRRANSLAGNAPNACAVEISGTIEVTARGGSVLIADDTHGAVMLAESERHVVSTGGRTRAAYLALAGGVDAPLVLGGRGTLLSAGIGGLLRKGGRLVPSAGPADMAASRAQERPAPSDEPIALMLGPDAADFSTETLATGEFRIAAASDRTGTRLEGPTPSALEASGQSMARRSTPMVMGAIELTPSGLIVLGPDHPTTGGYPVIAVVRSTSLDRLFSRPLGASVRFAIDVRDTPTPSP
jgi:KipI family sensor histidine kinase inhibitor